MDSKALSKGLNQQTRKKPSKQTYWKSGNHQIMFNRKLPKANLNLSLRSLSHRDHCHTPTAIVATNSARRPHPQPHGSDQNGNDQRQAIGNGTSQHLTTANGPEKVTRRHGLLTAGRPRAEVVQGDQVARVAGLDHLGERYSIGLEMDGGWLLLVLLPVVCSLAIVDVVGGGVEIKVDACRDEP